MLEFLFKSNLIFTTTGSLGARLGKVQAHQTRQFTLNMLDFLKKKLDFILPPYMGISRARVGEVQAHQMRQFTSNILDFLFKSYLIFTTTGSSRV
jgi:hypothetical protein